MRLALVIIPVLILGLGFSYANASTISQYCNNGTCVTGSVNIPTNYTYSTKHIPLLVVSYSQTCEKMIKYNIPGCPPLESIYRYDTSNEYISGHFIKQGNQTIRTPPQVKNHWIWYEQNKNTTVCIECIMDISASQESQNIIIQPTSYSFADKNPDHLVTNQISYLKDRYMQGCDTATISNIPGLLNDTINYMLSGCTITDFNGNVTKTVHQTAWDYNNPYSTLHYQDQIKQLMNGHFLFSGNHTGGGLGPADCIRHACSFTDPYKKAGW